MRDMSPRLTAKAERQMEENWDNEKEAWALLDLINAEFQSDPMSQQCFDRRIVDRVAMCLAKRKVFEKESPFFYG